MKENNPNSSVLNHPPAKVLTIAGSDSGGAAGLQADLKTFTALGVYGMSVLTIATAQNSIKVDAVHPFPTEFVASQIDAVLLDYGTDAVKTGFINRVDLVVMIAEKLRQYGLKSIVVDPVLVDHHGRSMFKPEITQAYITHLLPLADIVTPNHYEAALLTKNSLPEQMSLNWLKTTAQSLHALGVRNVLIKGGRIGENSVDVFFDGLKIDYLYSTWIETQNTHGSGDTLSAAICALLAQGNELKPALIKAHQFTAGAIEKSAGWKLGHGHGPVAQY